MDKRCHFCNREWDKGSICKSCRAFGRADSNKIVISGWCWILSSRTGFHRHDKEWYLLEKEKCPICKELIPDFIKLAIKLGA